MEKVGFSWVKVRFFIRFLGSAFHRTSLVADLLYKTKPHNLQIV